MCLRKLQKMCPIKKRKNIINKLNSLGLLHDETHKDALKELEKELKASKKSLSDLINKLTPEEIKILKSSL